MRDIEDVREAADYIAKYVSKGFKTKGSERYGENREFNDAVDDVLRLFPKAIVIPNRTTQRLPSKQRRKVLTKYYREVKDKHPFDWPLGKQAE